MPPCVTHRSGKRFLGVELALKFRLGSTLPPRWRPLPASAEQQRIVAEVERRLSVVEELETVVNANLQRAIRLRQSVLQRTFSGNSSSDE